MHFYFLKLIRFLRQRVTETGKQRLSNWLTSQMLPAAELGQAQVRKQDLHLRLSTEGEDQSCLRARGRSQSQAVCPRLQLTYAQHLPFLKLLN